MTYSEKLKDPRWQKKRLEILQRDQFTCRMCFDSTNTLHVHHRYYIGKNPWDTPNEGLVTLCQCCHEEIELTAKRYKKSKLNIQKLGFVIPNECQACGCEDFEYSLHYQTNTIYYECVICRWNWHSQKAIEQKGCENA